MENPGRNRHRPLLRIALALPFLVCCSAGALLSQGNCVAISRSGQEKLSTLPGRILTTAFAVSNLSFGGRRFETRLELPSGWRNLTPDIPFSLQGNRTDVRLLSIAVPAAASPGLYQVRYAVSDDAMPPCRSEIAVEVTVEPLRRIDLLLQEAPRYVVSGSSCTVTFALRNLGNELSTVRFSVRPGETVRAVPESSQVTLGPRESRSIAVVASPDPLQLENSKYVLELRAVLAQDSAVAVAASCLLEVIPTVTSAEMQFHEIPLNVKVRAAGENGLSGGQVQAEGGGTITDRGTDRVDLLVRTPDIQSRSILGLHDEYRLSYVSDKYRAEVGDRSYELSPLTELARYAFGAGGQFTAGNVTAGGFANQTRYYTPLQNEQAGFVTYAFEPGTSVGVNYLRKEDFHISDVATVRGFLRPLEGNDVELEYGMSALDGAHDEAYAARAAGYEKWISYDVRFIHAGPAYGGYYRNVDFKSATVNARPWSNLRIEAFAQDERQNLQDDTLQLVAPRDRYYQFGAGWGELLAVYYRQTDQVDLLPFPKYDRRESSVQFRSGYSFPAGNVYGSVDLGSSREFILKNSGPLSRFQLSANFRPEEHQSYGFTVEYLREQNLNSASEVETWSGSLNAAITIASRARILASLYGTKAGPPFEQSYTLVDVGVEYEFPFKHTLALRGRQSVFSPSPEGTQTAWLIEYSIPFSVPVTRLSGAGVLRGRVEDAVTREGVPNVVLYAGGATAVSDRSGEYLFPSLKPDIYTLTPDLGSAGVDRVTTRPPPFLATVLGGEETRLDVSVIRSGVIAGAVTVYDFSEAPAADTSRAGSNILVELTGQYESLRRFTDNRGRFQFSDLRPGDWTIRISGEGIPEFHYIERDSIGVTLLPGERKEALVRVLPKKRKIQILNEGNTPGQVQPPVLTPSPAKENARPPKARRR